MLRLNELNSPLLETNGDLALCGPGETFLELIVLLEKGLRDSCENLDLLGSNLVFIVLRSGLKFLFCGLSNRFQVGVACRAPASAS